MRRVPILTLMTLTVCLTCHCVEAQVFISSTRDQGDSSDGTLPAVYPAHDDAAATILTYHLYEPDDPGADVLKPEEQNADSGDELPNANVTVPPETSTNEFTPTETSYENVRNFFYGSVVDGWGLSVGVSQNFIAWREGSVGFRQGGMNSSSHETLRGPVGSYTGLNAYAGPRSGFFQFGFAMPFARPPETVIETKTDMFTFGNDTRHDIRMERPLSFYADMYLPGFVLYGWESVELHAKGGVMWQRISNDVWFDQTSGGGGLTRIEHCSDYFLPFLGVGAYWTPPRFPRFQLFGTANFMLDSSRTVRAYGSDSFGRPTQLEFTPALPVAMFSLGILWQR